MVEDPYFASGPELFTTPCTTHPAYLIHQPATTAQRKASEGVQECRGRAASGQRTSSPRSAGDEQPPVNEHHHQGFRNEQSPGFHYVSHPCCACLDASTGEGCLLCPSPLLLTGLA